MARRLSRCSAADITAANALAVRLGDFLGIKPAITTASDVAFGTALDDLPPGWSLDKVEAAKTAMAALLAGEKSRLDVRQGDAGWLATRLPQDAAGSVRVRITDMVTPADGSDLVLRPPTLALGVGCERGTSPEELIGLVDDTLAREKSGRGLDHLRRLARPESR